MKIWSSPYTIQPFQSLNALSGGQVQVGALLKIQWPDGLTGYADLHPWSSLGDLSLDQQLADLKNGKISLQVEQSIWLARRDAKMRAENKNIFDYGAPVKNNYVATQVQSLSEDFFQELRTQGFTHIKVKMGRDLEQEKVFLSQAAAADFRLRLDFNGMGSWPIFERFMTSLPKTVLPYIEYVEDPFRYEESEWREARRLVKIAVDNQLPQVKWNFSQVPFDVVVIKPAKTDVDLLVQRCLQHELSMVVTSYMDHTIGMFHALGVAMELKKTYPNNMLTAGCLTHQLFKRDEFSLQVKSQGPFVLRVPGSGVGFDKLLETREWQLIKTA
jgi:O-succinylbenzoate synthase